MIRSIFIAGGVALAAVAWVASGQLSNGDTTPTDEVAKAPAVTEETLTQVRTRKSTARQHESSLVLFGRTEGVRSVQVKVETDGRIIAVPVNKGKTVKKGEIIARIAMADRNARLKEAEALVERYAIAFEAAQKLSQKQFRSKVQLAESRSNLETAKSGLRSMRVDIERTVIRAPFDGVLEDVPVDIGDYVAIGDVSATVVDLDPILVVGEVTELASSRMKVGDKAVVTPVGADRVEGIVSYISKVGSPLTRTFRAEITLDNPGGVIAEGLTAEIRLEQGGIKAHFVTPAVLTLNDSGELGVKGIGPDDIVRFYKVKIVDDTPEGIWLTGLPDEAELIIVGQEFVRSGQKVKAIDSAAEGAS